MSSNDEKTPHKTPNQEPDVVRTQRIQQLNEIDQVCYSVIYNINRLLTEY